MNPIVAEWMEKARRDRSTAGREFRARPDPNFDAVCFHAQQSVEKLMKAVLIEHGHTPARTHNLVTLNDDLVSVCGDWAGAADDLRLLSLAAVQFRYPGASATEEDARQALAACDRVRQALLTLLPRPN